MTNAMAGLLEKLFPAVGADALWECLEPLDLYSLLWVNRCCSKEAASHRAHRIWKGPRRSWKPYSSLFRPGATEEDLICLERRVGQIPKSIRAIMQECQGAFLPCGFQASVGEAMTDLLPTSAWQLLDTHREAFPEDSREVQRLVVGGNGKSHHVLLRMDTWSGEDLYLRGSEDVRAIVRSHKCPWNSRSGLAEWILRKSPDICPDSVCCAGAYIEHLKITAREHYGNGLQDRFSDAASMIRGLLEDSGPLHLHHSMLKEWELSCGAAWQAATLACFASRPIPWPCNSELRWMTFGTSKSDFSAWLKYKLHKARQARQ